MTKYFLICNNRLVKGISNSERIFLAWQAYEHKNNSWVEIDRNEINDRLMGYDPTEDDAYAFGNTEILEEIQEVEEEDLKDIIKKINRVND